MDNHVEPVEAVMTVLSKESIVPISFTVQRGSLMNVHIRVKHLNNDTIIKLVKYPCCDFFLTDKRREVFYTCSHGKQTKTTIQGKTLGNTGLLTGLEVLFVCTSRA